MDRITREEFFKEAALLISRRSSCLKKQVGALLVIDNRVIAQGYNGVLPGVDPINGMDEDGTTHTVHAEANLISFCAKHGIATDGAIMYITLSPCEKCAELMVQAGIKKVYYIEQYKDLTGIDILLEQDIKAKQI